MSDSFPPPWQQRPAVRERAVNIPAVVLALAAVFVGIHFVREFVIRSPEASEWVVTAFAFIPDRVTTDLSLANTPGGDLARYWSFLTYAFLHGDWTHVLVNVVWMIPFGSPLGFRLGPVRFLAFSAVGAIARALAHLAFFFNDNAALIGASAAISAYMGGVVRFAFGIGAPFFGPRSDVYRRPAPPLLVTLRHPRAIGFILIWMATNLLFGLAPVAQSLFGAGQIAWDAHLGGFLAGLLLFGLFDRRT